MSQKSNGPKVLLFDIETAPMLVYAWSLWDESIAPNQIVEDWAVLSWSAKWLDAKEVMYMDNRNAKYPREDKKILRELWRLLDEADIVVTQNGKQFDEKKLNARFVIHGMPRPSSYRHIDTKQIAKQKFGFTSNRLEYMAEKLNKKYFKEKHAKFQGMELWKECLKGNLQAWKEMEKYNKHDVLALEELFKTLAPWSNTVNFSVYHERPTNVCSCGSSSYVRNGYFYTNRGKYQRFKCSDCGHETRANANLLSKKKKRSLLA